MQHIDMSDAFKKMFNALSKEGICRHDEDKPLYKYVSIDTAKMIIGNGTIKFSTPEELNDNDLDVNLFDLGVTEETQKKILNKIIHKNVEPNLAKFLEYNLTKSNSKFNLPTEVFTKELEKGYLTERTKFGIFCLTNDNKNANMWKKYGENNKGVCLEFKFPSLYTKMFYTFTVNYVSELTPYKLFDEDGSVNSLSVNRWLFTKHDKYSYEKEVRMVTENRIGINPFVKEFLAGIHYGKLTSENDINDLEVLLQCGEYNIVNGKRIEY
jgi:hypothetical protein